MFISNSFYFIDSLLNETSPELTACWGFLFLFEKSLSTSNMLLSFAILSNKYWVLGLYQRRSVIIRKLYMNVYYTNRNLVCALVCIELQLHTCNWFTPTPVLGFSFLFFTATKQENNLQNELHIDFVFLLCKFSNATNGAPQNN